MQECILLCRKKPLEEQGTRPAELAARADMQNVWLAETVKKLVVHRDIGSGWLHVLPKVLDALFQDPRLGKLVSNA
jgi:hypothetical protein